MGRGENDVGQIVEGFEHVEAAHARHLHIEENEVGRVGVDSSDGLPAIATLRDDLDLRVFFEILQDESPCWRLVVYDDCLQGHYDS